VADAELQLEATEHAAVGRRLVLTAELRVARVDRTGIGVVADQGRTVVADARLTVLGAVADVAVVALGVAGAGSGRRRGHRHQQDEGKQTRKVSHCHDSLPPMIGANTLCVRWSAADSMPS